MHPYLITSKPGRIRRAGIAAGTVAVRLVAIVAMVALGVIVFAIRCTRPVVTYVAERAAWTEAWASRVTGLPPVGAAVGAGLTAEFIREFRNGWHEPAADH